MIEGNEITPTRTTAQEEQIQLDVTKLNGFLAMREAAFAQLQSTYELSRTAGADNVKLFLARCNELLDLRNRFYSYSEKIMTVNARLPEEEQANVTAAMKSFDEVYYQVRAVESSFSTQFSGSQPSRSSEIRPPRIDVPKWTGDMSNFHNWFALFNSVVHKGAFTPTTKFAYLRSLLSGPPLKMIETMEISDENYPIAYEKIYVTYADPRVLAAYHVDSMLDFKPMSSESLSELQSFLTVFDSNHSAYLNVNIPDHTDFLLFQCALRKLPNSMRLLFERAENESPGIPTFQRLVQFIREQCRIKQFFLPTASSSSTTTVTAAKTSPLNFSTYKKPQTKFATTLLVSPAADDAETYSSSPSTTSQPSCPVCQESHNIYVCEKYNKMSPSDRYQLVKSLNRCFRCLAKHPRLKCSSTGACRFCRSSRHHSSLHNDDIPRNYSTSGNTQQTPIQSTRNTSTFKSTHTTPTTPSSTVNSKTPSTTKPSSTANGKNPPTTTASTPYSTKPSTSTSSYQESTSDNPSSLLTLPSHSEKYVLLGTAQCFLRDSSGSWAPIRLVIDIGSQVNLISTDVVQRLKLPMLARSTQICGAMDQVVGSSHGQVSCVLAPAPNVDPQLCATAVVVPKICAPSPSVSLPPQVIDKFSTLSLADRTFHQRGSIDFLLGAGLYSQLFQSGYEILHGEPAAIKTIFGWVIFGNVGLTPLALNVCGDPNVSPDGQLDSLVQRFWQVEEVSSTSHKDPLHVMAENHFRETTTRLANGQYCVRLPFAVDSTLPPFGSSREIATRRWLNVEARLQKNEKIREAYHAFMEEYLALGHMVPASKPGTYIIPHFAITKASDPSQIRIVFDASTPDSSNFSANARLLKGSPLQKNTPDVLMYFRLKSVAITTDIKKMYRAIRLHDDDCTFQHILWRKSPDQPLQEYELKTVTYGLSSSPFQAIRCLIQLCEDEGAPYPAATRAILNSCLMDDVCWSVDSEEAAMEFRVQLVELMAKGQFELRKWASNSSKVLDGIPEQHRAKVLNVRPNELESLMILGLQWYPQDDCFSYTIDIPSQANTKRTILSQVASIYDPLGWLAPVVFWAKHFLQQLWAAGLDWDTPLPDMFLSRWAEFAATLPQLSAVRLPRLCVSPSLPVRQIIGFCDGSTMGYGAVIYLRCANQDESEVTVHLITSKTKVASLKVQTVPRLELNGALLLAKLLKSVETIQKELLVSEVILFTDASTVLSWLRTPSHQLKTYVANRVVAILDIAPLHTWRHIPSASNGADCASRGLTPVQLLQFSTWWAGPEFLYRPTAEWPNESFELSPLYTQELKKSEETKVLNVVKRVNPNKQNLVLTLIESHSSLTHVKRVLGYVLRFIANCRCKKPQRVVGWLRSDELRKSMSMLVRKTQHHHFIKDIQAIRKGRLVSKKLRTYSPYVDSDGFLRVGGRLKHANLPANTRHPLLLPSEARLSKLICNYYHLFLLHSGPQATQAMVQRQFWILSLRPTLRRIIHQCHTCYKSKAKINPPEMGNLPAERVTPPPRPFTNTGVDMAGPLLIKEHNRRNARLIKVYVCVFVCMATKAVHLELVSDLSTPAYLAALDRFMARRGLCAQIFCDQGTNFVGAGNEMKDIIRFLKESEGSVAEYLSTREIMYQFNPPASPWMGGLWEAAVKSFKQHLMKTTLHRSLTFEEMLTVLTRVEGVLNSRPLLPSTSDPEADTDFLSPGHFLIGAPLLAAPEIDVTDTPENHLSRWQLVRRATQEFWKRWSNEYLNTLIQRKKWNTPRSPLHVGQPVFIAKENTKPLDWPLGIVENLIPGSDGVHRVAQVRTSYGQYTRPVARLIPLPKED